MGSREEEYLRRMKALGYEPSLRGMDDEDIEWELSKMEEAERRQEAPQPLRTVYRPVDPGLKARILRMFGQPYDESAIPKGQEFYLNGWDNGEDGEEVRNPVTQSQGRKSDFNAPDFDPWKNAWKLDWGKESNILADAQKMVHWPSREGATFPSRGAARPLSYAASGGAEGTGLQFMQGSIADKKTASNFFSEPKLHSKYQGPNPPDTQLQDTFPPHQKPQNNEDMKVSSNLIPFIKKTEGPGLRRYKVDENGNETIGYGHEIKEGENIGEEITEEQADELLMKDLNEIYGKEVNEWARENNVKLTQQQFDALVSLHYNLNIYQAPTLMNLIKRGDASPQEVRDAFALYYTSKGVPYRGLWTRRADEADMYLKGDYRRKEDRPVPGGIDFK